MGNTFKTAFFLTLLTLLLMFIGRAFGGQNGMLLALAFAAVLVLRFCIAPSATASSSQAMSV